MGNNPSSDGSGSVGGSDSQTPFHAIPPHERHGWKVMSVAANSPSSGFGIVPYFSVLTHVNGTRLGHEEADLLPLIREGQPAQLTFLNLSTLLSHTLTITPRRGWGGEGLLGLQIRHEDFSNAHLEAIHVLDVYPGSPAAVAGFRPHEDYLLGTSRIAFKGYEALDLFLTQFESRSATVLVFNSQSWTVRDVAITPKRGWGGNGTLGCDVGFGLLHQLAIDGRREVTYAGDQSGGKGANTSVQHAGGSTGAAQIDPTSLPVPTAPLRVLPTAYLQHHLGHSLTTFNPQNQQIDMNVVLTEAPSAAAAAAGATVGENALLMQVTVPDHAAQQRAALQLQQQEQQQAALRKQQEQEALRQRLLQEQAEQEKARLEWEAQKRVEAEQLKQMQQMRLQQQQQQQRQQQQQQPQQPAAQLHATAAAVSQHSHAHGAGDHGHSHGAGDHGHSHGPNDSHAHSHSPPQQSQASMQQYQMPQMMQPQQQQHPYSAMQTHHSYAAAGYPLPSQQLAYGQQQQAQHAPASTQSQGGFAAPPSSAYAPPWSAQMQMPPTVSQMSANPTPAQTQQQPHNPLHHPHGLP